MAAESPPYAIQASSHGAALFRQALTSLFGQAQPGTLAASDGGVVNPTDLAVTQNGTPNMSVNVAGGSCWIPQTNASDGGLYFGLNDATLNLAISAANATNPRIDTIVATVNDAAYSGSTNNWVLQVLTGTPTSGATLSNLSGKAGLAASSIPIAYVLVPANATTIVTADLLDGRTFVTLLNSLRGILIGAGFPLSGSPPSVKNGQFYLQASAVTGTTSGFNIAETFPTAFPNGVLAVLVTPTNGVNGTWTFNIAAASSSGFTLETSVNTGAVDFCYLAIGF